MVMVLAVYLEREPGPSGGQRESLRCPSSVPTRSELARGTRRPASGTTTPLRARLTLPMYAQHLLDCEHSPITAAWPRTPRHGEEPEDRCLQGFGPDVRLNCVF